MPAVTARTIIGKIMSLFGDVNNSSNEAEERVQQLFTKQREYFFPELHYTAAKRVAMASEAAQTISISASHPLGERHIFTARKPCTITAVHYHQRVSSTVTATNTMAWALQINKRAAKFTSLSATTSYSLTTFIAGITSCSTKGGSKSWSWSALTRNTNTLLPNPCHLRRDATKLEMGEMDILTARVRKGSSVAGASSDDSGAIFRGGKIVVYYRED